MTQLRTHLEVDITPQPDEATCGPLCLHAVYRYYGDDMPLAQVVDEIEQLPTGGTLAVQLARHAMRRGYRASIYTCNLRLFDPTWFGPAAPPMRERLLEQARRKRDAKLRKATDAYIDFLQRGGTIFMEDLTGQLIAGILETRAPIIAALSATWLYRCARERPVDNVPDDVAGEPVGHFVLLHGMDRQSGHVKVADPWSSSSQLALGESPSRPGDRFYEVEVERLIASILLGIVTDDAKLVVIRSPQPATGEVSRGGRVAECDPASQRPGKAHANSSRRE